MKKAAGKAQEQQDHRMPSLRYRPEFGEQSFCKVKMSAVCFLRKMILTDKTHTNSASHCQPNQWHMGPHGTWDISIHSFLSPAQKGVHCTVDSPCLNSLISLPLQKKELQTADLLGEGFNPKPSEGKVSLPPRRGERLPSQQHMLPPPASLFSD